MKKLFLSLACLCALVSSAQATLIDDFSSGSLSAYTQTTVLDQNTTATNNSFSINASGAIISSSTNTGGSAEQTVLLRSDYSVSVGQTLLADATDLGTSSTFAELGIIVAASSTPTYLTRSEYVVCALREQNAGDNVAAQYATVTGPISGTGGQIGIDFSTVASIYIKRTGSLTYETGFIKTDGTSTTVKTYTVDNASIGNAVGFYTDIRYAVSSSGSLDNLRVVPEPASVLMLIGGVVGLALLRRRK